MSRFTDAPLLALALATVAGCAVLPAGDAPAPPPELAALAARAGKAPGARHHLAQGVREMHAGNLDAAARHFNKGLKFDPQDANLNFLNAFVYHLRAEGGDHAQGELAEVGYRLALKFDPNHWLAAYRLGKLHWEQRRYAAAQDAFARALLAEPDNARAAYGLAAASYAAGDPLTARAALTRLPAAAANSPEVLRTRALVHAALGLSDVARKELHAYRARAAAPGQADHAARRVAAWGALHAQGPGSAPMMAPGSGPGPAPGAAPPAASANMVILDAVIIGREQSRSTRTGVNLLAGLSLQFGANLIDYSRNVMRDLVTHTTPQHEERASTGFTITLPAVTYSLNIANAQDGANRILARPSVLAHDGVESEVFIGSELTYTAVGNLGGTSFTKEIGLLLKVTPRFQQNGRLTLAVQTEFGTFAPTAAPGTFREAVATVKNRSRITADMAIGQTLVVAAGSTARDSDIRDGVPVLRDVPLLQYFFSTRDSVSQEASVLMLITPRLPASPESLAGDLHATAADAPAAEPASPALRQLRSRYGAWWKPTSNVLLAMHALRGLPIEHEFRRGDVQFIELGDATDTQPGERVRGVLRDLLKLLYF